MLLPVVIVRRRRLIVGPGGIGGSLELCKKVLPDFLEHEAGAPGGVGDEIHLVRVEWNI